LRESTRAGPTATIVGGLEHGIRGAGHSRAKSVSRDPQHSHHTKGPALRSPRHGNVNSKKMMVCGGSAGTEAEVVEPRMPTTANEVKYLSWEELTLVFALRHATEIRAAVDSGEDALRSELESWGPEERATLALASLRSAEPPPGSDIRLTLRPETSVHRRPAATSDHGTRRSGSDCIIQEDMGARSGLSARSWPNPATLERRVAAVLYLLIVV
jgi:hypothetical protein